ncbi:MAG: AAA family ATPase [Methylococcaceae bacterium]
MLKQLSIKNFKSIGNQSFELKPLTILTGLNSTGKSSVIQSILLLSKHASRRNQGLVSDYVENFSDFSEIRNKYLNAKSLSIKAKNEQHTFSLSMDYDKTTFTPKKECSDLNFEDKLYYVSANRIGQESLASFSKEQKTGRHGEYIFGYFESNKDKPLFSDIIKFKDSSTLKYQVNGWLNYILELSINLQTDKITATHVRVSFDVDGINDINPFNIGAGNSYLAKILITGLLCNKDDILLIENPEIHLHPKAQSRLGEFFAWLAQNGIQLIVETHSEHLINKLRHQVYRKMLDADNITIYYKESITKDFMNIAINNSGHFINSAGERMQFPSGFFDSTLKELLEIG